MSTDTQKADVAPDPAQLAEDAQWAALQEEIGAEDELLEPSEPEGEPEVQARQPEAAPEKPQPSAEELQTNYRNVQTALQQERARRQQSEERLQGITELIANLRAKHQPEQAAQPEVKQPTVEEDPIGYFNGKIAHFQAELAKLQQGSQQSTQQVQAQLQEQQFWGTVERSEIELRKAKPDYDDACRHLETGRVKELARMLPDSSPQAQAMAQQGGFGSVADLRAAMLNRDRIAVAQQAMMLGKSPAELYYELAQERGWAGLPANSPLAAQPKPKASALETQRRGQKAAKTLSGGTGGKGAEEMSLDDLTDLYAEDPEEFDKMWDKMQRAGRLG